MPGKINGRSADSIYHDRYPAKIFFSGRAGEAVRSQQQEVREFHVKTPTNSVNNQFCSNYEQKFDPKR
jgi:hypothetical protein